MQYITDWCRAKQNYYRTNMSGKSGVSWVGTAVASWFDISVWPSRLWRWPATLLMQECGGLPYSGSPPFYMVGDRGWYLGENCFSSTCLSAVCFREHFSPQHLFNIYSPDCLEVWAALLSECWWHSALCADGWMGCTPGGLDRASQAIPGWFVDWN